MEEMGKKKKRRYLVAENNKPLEKLRFSHTGHLDRNGYHKIFFFLIFQNLSLRLLKKNNTSIKIYI